MVKLATLLCPRVGTNKNFPEEVIERLLLDGIDAVAAGATVCGQDDGAVMVRPNEAEAPLAGPELARPRADVALDPTIIKGVPVGGVHHAGYAGLIRSVLHAVRPVSRDLRKYGRGSTPCHVAWVNGSRGVRGTTGINSGSRRCGFAGRSPRSYRAPWTRFRL